jgi:hypothetical protein
MEKKPEIVQNVKKNVIPLHSFKSGTNDEDKSEETWGQ